ncbi:MAG: tRNA (adenosine(37)-N6)-dimethylallyltransferase MiaA [Candidatus Saccharimonadales bacterium]
MLNIPSVPLVVVVGQTASGKSSIALDIARKLNGEIISADSWTVYRGFDIGTAKPTAEERQEIKHHLIDIVDPNSGFNAAQFKTLAQHTIDDIHSRGKLPILVGGTGLYINSVLYDYGFMPAGSVLDRQARNKLSVEQLLQEANVKKLSTAGIDTRNKRRIIRLLETNGERPVSQPLRPNTLIVGLQVSSEQLRQRITLRVDHMFEKGLEQEVAALAQLYGWDVEPMKGIGYREWREYFQGSQNIIQTQHRIVSATLQLAKRQRTWFKRNDSIQWLDDPYVIVDLATSFLNK